MGDHLGIWSKTHEKPNLKNNETQKGNWGKNGCNVDPSVASNFKLCFVVWCNEGSGERLLSTVPYFTDDWSEPEGIGVGVGVEDAESKESQHDYEANHHKESGNKNKKKKKKMGSQNRHGGSRLEENDGTQIEWVRESTTQLQQEILGVKLRRVKENEAHSGRIMCSYVVHMMVSVLQILKSKGHSLHLLSRNLLLISDAWSEIHK